VVATRVEKVRVEAVRDEVTAVEAWSVEARVLFRVRVEVVIEEAVKVEKDTVEAERVEAWRVEMVRVVVVAVEARSEEYMKGAVAVRTELTKSVEVGMIPFGTRVETVRVEGTTKLVRTSCWPVKFTRLST
jgi:hypothetical protein